MLHATDIATIAGELFDHRWCVSPIVGRGRTFRCSSDHGQAMIAKCVDSKRVYETEALRAVEDYALCTPRLLALHEHDGTTILFTSELSGRLVADILQEPHDGGHAQLGHRIGEALASMNSIRFPRPGLLSAGGVKPVPYSTSIHWLESWVDSAKRRLSLSISHATVSLIREAERAVKTLHALERTPESLVHGDFSPKNLIVLDDGSIGILDWEYAKSFPGTFDVCRYLIDTHSHSLHVHAFWSAWAQLTKPRLVEVSAYLMIELLLHHGWAASQGRAAEQQTSQFLEQFHDADGINRWLESHLASERTTPGQLRSHSTTPTGS